MKRARLCTTALASAAAFTLAACGGGGGGSGSASGSGAIKIGIKFDQPGMGLKEGATYTGFDVDVAKYVATALGHKDSDITFIQAPSANRETLISTGQVAMVVGTYSITDKRKKKVSFAGPYFIAGQDLLVKANDTSITGPDSLKGKRLCSVKGSTSAAKVKEKYPAVQLQEYDTYSKCVEALSSGAIDAMTTDNTILAGYAAQPANKGKFKVVGKPFSTENYGVGLKKGDSELCTKVKDALAKMVSDGSWQKAFDANLGASGVKLDPAKNPPKSGQIACQ